MQNEFEKRDSKMMPLVMQIKGLRRNEDAMKYNSWYQKKSEIRKSGITDL